jgi:hypothetical protein
VRAVGSQAPQDRLARSGAPYRPDKMRISGTLWPPIPQNLHQTVLRPHRDLAGHSPEPRRSTSNPGLEVLRRGSGDAPAGLSRYAQAVRPVAPKTAVEIAAKRRKERSAAEPQANGSPTESWVDRIMGRPKTESGLADHHRRGLMNHLLMILSRHDSVSSPSFCALCALLRLSTAFSRLIVLLQLAPSFAVDAGES